MNSEDAEKILIPACAVTIATTLAFLGIFIIYKFYNIF